MTGGGLTTLVQPDAVTRHDRRSTSRKRGLSVSPGIRPRLAIGRPSICFRSPVKSMGVAPLMYEPTA